MSTPVLHERRFTYADYESWPDDERWELIEGEAYSMSPAPSFRHQTIVSRIHGQLYRQLHGKPCRPMVAPLDVRLTKKGPDGQSVTHVVQPDVLVFCDPALADDKGLTGAPDWVLEVLSDATSWKDSTVKLALYEEFGVKEYWILNPESGLLLVHLLDQGRYGVPTPYLGSVKVPVKTFPGLEIDLGED